MKHLLALLISMTTGLATVSHGQTPTLFGSQVTVIGYYPTLQDPFTLPATATVGPNVEFPAGSITALSGFTILSFNLDIGANFISAQYLLDQQSAVAPFNGLVLTFDSSSPVITGVSLDPSSTTTDIELGFGPHDVQINASGLTATPSTRYMIDLNLSPVPEPSTLCLVTVGLGCLVFMAVWRRAHTGSVGAPSKADT